MNREKPNRNESGIAVVPYILYDALMERFEHMQRNLRSIAIIAAILAVGLVVSVIKGTGNGNRNNSHAG